MSLSLSLCRPKQQVTSPTWTSRTASTCGIRTSAPSPARATASSAPPRPPRHPTAWFGSRQFLDQVWRQAQRHLHPLVRRRVPKVPGVRYKLLEPNRPEATIWVTEFACQNFNGGAQCNEGEVWSFVQQATAWMDQTEWIGGYAPFGTFRLFSLSFHTPILTFLLLVLRLYEGDARRKRLQNRLMNNDENGTPDRSRFIGSSTDS
jgi:hypothetical protein